VIAVTIVALLASHPSSSGNPGGLGFTTISQKTMDYVVNPGPGRDDFVRFWTLMAEAVKGHPSAFAAELMNEPMTIHRKAMFDCWRECAEAINKIVPDMSVSICDVGEGECILIGEGECSRIGEGECSRIGTDMKPKTQSA
jgi:hypothetical protein